MDVSKAYNENVPEFLRNRPKLFVDHCIRRMPPQVGALASDDFTFLMNDCCKFRQWRDVNDNFQRNVPKLLMP